VSIVSEAVEAVTGIKPELSTSGGTSDARYFRALCPVLEFGLLGTTMHMVNERTPVSEVEALTRIYEGVITGYFQAFAPAVAA
jgi:succinyl-diaminopimelate desuccinylase